MPLVDRFGYWLLAVAPGDPLLAVGGLDFGDAAVAAGIADENGNADGHRLRALPGGIVTGHLEQAEVLRVERDALPLLPVSLVITSHRVVFHNHNLHDLVIQKAATH
jgi:hypothetical protein